MPIQAFIAPYSSVLGVRQFVRDWQRRHFVPIDPKLEIKIAWDGQWLRSIGAAELKFYLRHWGVGVAIARWLSKDIAWHVKCLKEDEKKSLYVDLIALDGDKLANTRSEEWWPRVYVVVLGIFGSDTVYYCPTCICTGFHRGSRGTSSKVPWKLREIEVGMVRRLRTPSFRSRTWYILI
jgi:hypothetical protein